MQDIFDLALLNLLSPPVLFFALGFAASFARSDLEVPQAVAKALSLYLLLAIGFKGGVAMASHGIDGKLVASLAAGVVLSATLPLVAFKLLRLATNLPRVDAVAVAAHYGSISVVTFAAATSVLITAGIDYEGYLVAVAAAMETPAIVSALLLMRWGAGKDGAGVETNGGNIWREIAVNGSIVLLSGAFLIGWITGPKGLADIAPFIIDPFKGILCLFLLDMGLVAGRGIRHGRHDLSATLVAFGIVMPLIGGGLGTAAASLIGLSAGGAMLLATLAASASYIAVPAAMRLALPDARPAIYLTMSLGVTFPFNLIIGIPIYLILGNVAGG
ncbi:MAG: sodium-dependent bicarbonate transport family permease [Rhodospirillaceae bacterium]